MRVAVYGSIFLLFCAVANIAHADKMQERLEPESKGTVGKEQKPSLGGAGVSKESRLLKEWSPEHEGVAIAHKQNYLLLYAYSSSPNNMPVSPNPDNRVPFSQLDNRDWKFQVSGKGKLFPVNEKNSIWLAYTQQSFWQIFDSHNSRPFRESNYEPEVIWSHRYLGTGRTGLSQSLRVSNFGLVHQSNGQSNPRSRSWNRAYIQLGFESDLAGGGKVIVMPKIWARFPEDAATDDNSDITHYLGHGELQVRYMSSGEKPKFHMLALARARSLQIDMDTPVSGVFPRIKSDFSLHFQLFTGYGESLLDYNQRHSSFGIGAALAL